MIKLELQMFAEDLTNIFKKVGEVIKDVNVDNVSSESSEQFVNLPDGYYYAEVESAELTLSSKGDAMVKWVLKNIEDGVNLDENDKFQYIKSTINKKHFVYSSLKDSNTMQRFISDALKFEGDTPGESYLEKEYFTTPETLNDALGLLEGRRIWLHVDTTENRQGGTSTWTRFISFKRATLLGLES